MRHNGSFAYHGTLINHESCCSMCCVKEILLEEVFLFAAVRGH